MDRLEPMHFLYLLPRTACSVSIYLLALHVAVLCTTCIPLNALTPLSCHSFLNSMSRLLTCAANAPYLSSISLHLRGRSFMSSTYPPSTQRVCSHSARSSWSRCRLFSVTLLPRLPLPFGLSVSYPPFYPMPQHTHFLHLHTAYRT